MGDANVEALLGLARKAGRVILEIYARGAPPGAPEDWAGKEMKADATPVTEADRRADALIVAGLRHLTPGIPVVSEEGSGSGTEPPGDARSFWLVDPLDGTREFLARTGDFTVNIGLVQDGRPVAGVVHLPATGRSWVADADGAWTVDEAEWSAIHTRPATPELLTLAASRRHRGEILQGLLAKHPDDRIIITGSSVKFCLLAEGHADLYLRDTPTSEWDTAAAHAVLRAAGGEVFTLEGPVLTYGKSSLVNPALVAVGDPNLDWRTVVGREPAE